METARSLEEFISCGATDEAPGNHPDGPGAVDGPGAAIHPRRPPALLPRGQRGRLARQPGEGTPGRLGPAKVRGAENPERPPRCRERVPRNPRDEGVPAKMARVIWGFACVPSKVTGRDGQVTSAFGVVPLTAIRGHRPRQSRALTEEDRRAAADRLQKVRSSRGRTEDAQQNLRPDRTIAPGWLLRCHPGYHGQ